MMQHLMCPYLHLSWEWTWLGPVRFLVQARMEGSEVLSLWYLFIYFFLVVFIFPLVKEQSHCLWAVSSALLLSWYYIRLPEMPKLMWNCQAFLWLWPQPSAVSFSSRLPSLWPRWCHHHHPCPECELIRASGPDVTQRLCWLSFFFSPFHEANRVFCGI